MKKGRKEKKRKIKGEIEEEKDTRKVPGVVFVKIDLLDNGDGDGLRGALSAEVVKD